MTEEERERIKKAYAECTSGTDKPQLIVSEGLIYFRNKEGEVEAYELEGAEDELP